MPNGFPQPQYGAPTVGQYRGLPRGARGMPFRPTLQPTGRGFGGIGGSYYPGGLSRAISEAQRIGLGTLIPEAARGIVGDIGSAALRGGLGAAIGMAGVGLGGAAARVGAAAARGGGIGGLRALVTDPVMRGMMMSQIGATVGEKVGQFLPEPLRSIVPIAGSLAAPGGGFRVPGAMRLAQRYRGGTVRLPKEGETVLGIIPRLRMPSPREMMGRARPAKTLEYTVPLERAMDYTPPGMEPYKMPPELQRMGMPYETMLPREVARGAVAGPTSVAYAANRKALERELQVVSGNVDKMMKNVSQIPRDIQQRMLMYLARQEGSVGVLLRPTKGYNPVMGQQTLAGPMLPVGFPARAAAEALEKKIGSAIKLLLQNLGAGT